MPETKDIIKLLDKGNVDGALDLADDVKDKKGIALILNNYAAILAKELGVYDASKKILTKVIEIDPGLSEAYYNLGCLYSEPEMLSEKSQNLKKSKEAYKKAIELDPKHVRAHYNLGLLYAFTGELEKARKEYSACLRIDKENIAKYDYLEGIIKSKSV